MVFEKGAWKAVRQEFPEASVKECAFHFAQDVWRKTQELGLKSTYSLHGQKYRCIRSLMALPFLPAADIGPAFEHLQSRASSSPLQQLVRYISESWLTSPVWKPSNWNVYQLSIRTNNDVEGLMKIMYTLAKKHQSVSSGNVLDFVDWCTDLGADYLTSIHQGANAQYTSERVMQELLAVLAGTLRDSILADARQSPVFGVQADETTDVSVKSQVVSYIRYMKAYGKYITVTHCHWGTVIKTSFLGIRELRDGKAQTVHAKVVQMLTEADLDMEHRLSGFTSDGAAVMCGRKAGVEARLKETVPWMLSYHCANHRTALAAAHASDAVPAVKKAKESLGHIFRFFSYSAVRTENLKEIQRVLNMPVVKIQQAKDVRWLSHHQAVTAMLKCYPAVITTLEYEAEERNCPTARGLAHQLRTFNFVAFLHMMADVLPPLKIMTQLFQAHTEVHAEEEADEAHIEVHAEEADEAHIEVHAEEEGDQPGTSGTSKKRKSTMTLEEIRASLDKKTTVPLLNNLLLLKCEDDDAYEKQTRFEGKFNTLDLTEMRTSRITGKYCITLSHVTVRKHV
ncbi:PREDICTED: uncharacterized protein LOC106815742 [Priapulus caudatus]|uniref:Uncharacterized protein LOC106815742 n=1 Tax=Priapulus caudatus TaxID=37621 RepID=A0ABM1EU66_PRICU|nr:PREDICTED: uncharacterized protein LOC106815742 [Priapulus caudatus]